MPPRDDPFGAYRFRVEIDGIAVAAFSEVSGLASETQVVEYRTGTDLAVRKLPGLTKFSNIVLRRGVTVGRELWDWRKAVVDGAADRRDGAVVLLDRDGSEMLRWRFREAWPCKWEGPTLDAKASHVAVETLELAHEGLELDG